MVVSALCAFAAAPLVASQAGASSNTAKVTVVATGLNAPRGMAFGPGGGLYVAEAGTGGSHSTTDQQCAQVVPPVGPYLGGFTSLISKISADGHRTVVASGLPSNQTSATVGSLVSGVADLAFLNGRLYGVDAGAGCSHGHLSTPQRLFRVNLSNGTTSQIANLSEYLLLAPQAAHENTGDFEPDGTWYSMITVGDTFFAVEPNHGEVDAITPEGIVSRFIDVSAAAANLCSGTNECGDPPGHVVPTGITYHNGNFYVVNLDVFDTGFENHSHVYKITKTGAMSIVAGGLNAAVGVAFDNQGRLYALESFTGGFAPVPNSGAVVRWNGSGWDTIASGLNFPTAMKLGPDGDLYVSNCGYLCPPHAGQILRVDIN